LSASPAKPLPFALSQIYDETSDDVGVIEVSFGSTAYRMPDRFVRRLMDAFRQLNQTVVARIYVPDGFDVPKNVKLMKWLPQNYLLGNGKTRLFVTHCGSHGQYEALFHGVPMLGLPMFTEQIWNCDRARRKHFRLTIEDFFDDGGNLGKNDDGVKTSQ
jgi:glucuronosyltransferase